MRNVHVIKRLYFTPTRLYNIRQTMSFQYKVNKLKSKFAVFTDMYNIYLQNFLNTTSAPEVISEKFWRDEIHARSERKLPSIMSNIHEQY